jgi:hypothetical protein
MLYYGAGFKPTGGWQSIHRCITSYHVEVKNTSFLRVVFKCPSLFPVFVLELQQKGIYHTLQLRNVKHVNNLGEIYNNICDTTLRETF